MAALRATELSMVPLSIALQWHRRGWTSRPTLPQLQQKPKLAHTTATVQRLDFATVASPHTGGREPFRLPGESELRFPRPSALCLRTKPKREV